MRQRLRFHREYLANLVGFKMVYGAGSKPFISLGTLNAIVIANDLKYE